MVMLEPVEILPLEILPLEILAGDHALLKSAVLERFYCLKFKK
jgi:hypothetical protein